MRRTPRQKIKQKQLKTPEKKLWGWGYNTQATLYDMAAKQAKKAAKRNTISTILGGGSNLLFMGAQAGWSGGRSSGNGVTERGGGTSSATINGIYQGSRTW